MQRAEIHSTVTAFLCRFTPPKQIADNDEHMAEEADLIVNEVARFAPGTGFPDWWREVGTELVRRMKTRAWPMLGEVEAACRAVNDRSGHSGPKGGNSREVEAKCIDMMADWHAKFGTEMPRMGKPERTAELIRRGVLASERDARFKRYTLSAHQERRAVEQPPTRDEWRHHVRVTARLRGISEAEAEASLRMESRTPMDRSGAAIPDKSAPYDRNRFAA